MKDEEKTLDDLKAKYDEANQGKLDKEKIMEGILVEIEESEKKVAGLIVVQMKKCRERLNEIATRPHTMPSEEYLQQMIENEKNNQELGWQNREGQESNSNGARRNQTFLQIWLPHLLAMRKSNGWPVCQRGRQCKHLASVDAAMIKHPSEPAGTFTSPKQEQGNSSNTSKSSTDGNTSPAPGSAAPNVSAASSDVQPAKTGDGSASIANQSNSSSSLNATTNSALPNTSHSSEPAETPSAKQQGSSNLANTSNVSDAPGSEPSAGNSTGSAVDASSSTHNAAAPNSVPSVEAEQVKSGDGNASVANRSNASSARNETMNNSASNISKSRDASVAGDTHGSFEQIGRTTVEPTQTFWAAFVGFDTTELQPMAGRAGRAGRFLPRSAAVQL
eukprot:s24_g37.t1